MAGFDGIGSIDVVLNMDNREFSKRLRETQNELKDSRADFRLLSAEMNNAERSQEGLENSIEGLNRHLDRQKENLRQLEMAYERMDDSTDRARASKKRLADTIRNAKISIEGTQTSINRLENSLDDLGDEARETEKEMAGLKREMLETSLSAIGGASGMVAKVGALTSVISSMVPVLAVAVGGAGALGASMLALAGGLGAVGVVAVPFVTTVSEVADAVKEQTDIINDSTKSTKEKAQAQKELNRLEEEHGSNIMDSANALNHFKDEFQIFTEQFNEPLSHIFQEGLGVLLETLNQFSPVIDAVLPVIENLVDKLSIDLTGGGLQPFIEWLTTHAPTSLENFAKIFGNVFQAVINIFMAFTPLMGDMEGGLVSLTEKFLEWSKGLAESEGFQQFVDYVRTNAPIVIDIIKQIVTTIWDILVALAPLGQGILETFQEWLPTIRDWITNLAEVIGGLNPKVVLWGTAIAGVTSFLAPLIVKAISIYDTVQKFLPVIKTMITSMKNWQAITKLMQIAQGLLNVVMSANPIALVIIAVAGLVAGLVLAYNKSETFRNIVNKLWEKLKQLGSYLGGQLKGMLEGVVSIFNRLKDAVKSVFDWVSKLWNKFKDSSVGKVLGAITGLGGRSFNVEGTFTPPQLGNYSMDGYVSATRNTGANALNTIADSLGRLGSSTITETGTGNVITVNLHSPKELSVREANRQFGRTMDRILLQV